MEKRKYVGPYQERYLSGEHLPHVGDWTDPFNTDAQEKIDLGYIKIIEEGGEKYAVVTEKGRAALAGAGEQNPHQPTQALEARPSPSTYRRQIYAIVENLYGQEFRADFVDHMPEEKKKPHRYTLYVRPRAESKETKMQYKTKVSGTLKEIYDKLHDRLAEGMTLKVMKGL